MSMGDGEPGPLRLRCWEQHGVKLLLPGGCGLGHPHVLPASGLWLRPHGAQEAPEPYSVASPGARHSKNP
jgi:hypothetical protein